MIRNIQLNCPSLVMSKMLPDLPVDMVLVSLQLTIGVVAIHVLSLADDP